MTIITATVVVIIVHSVDVSVGADVGADLHLFSSLIYGRNITR